eukprot:12431467-Karenia_brevis.AAC.1
MVLTSSRSHVGIVHESSWDHLGIIRASPVGHVSDAMSISSGRQFGIFRMSFICGSKSDHRGIRKI